jgi:hypothetical protein
VSTRLAIAKIRAALDELERTLRTGNAAPPTYRHGDVTARDFPCPTCRVHTGSFCKGVRGANRGKRAPLHNKRCALARRQRRLNP